MRMSEKRKAKPKPNETVRRTSDVEKRMSGTKGLTLSDIFFLRTRHTENRDANTDNNKIKNGERNNTTEKTNEKNEEDQPQRRRPKGHRPTTKEGGSHEQRERTTSDDEDGEEWNDVRRRRIVNQEVNDQRTTELKVRMIRRNGMMSEDKDESLVKEVNEERSEVKEGNEQVMTRMFKEVKRKRDQRFN